MDDFAEVTDDDFSPRALGPRLTLAGEPVSSTIAPAIVVVEKKAASFTETLVEHQIVDEDSYLKCDELFHMAVTMLDEIAATFDPIIADANRAHKTALAQKAKHAKPIQDALAGLKQRFLAEQQKREAEAERLRLELEAKLKAEAAERQLDEAIALEGAGHADEAEQVLNEPTSAPSVAMEAVRHKVMPKLGKTSTSGRWKCVEADLKKLARAVADGVVPTSYILANATVLDARAAADKTGFNVPGCKAQFVPNVVVRR